MIDLEALAAEIGDEAELLTGGDSGALDAVVVLFGGYANRQKFTVFRDGVVLIEADARMTQRSFDVIAIIHRYVGDQL